MSLTELKNAINSGSMKRVGEAIEIYENPENPLNVNYIEQVLYARSKSAEAVGQGRNNDARRFENIAETLEPFADLQSNERLANRYQELRNNATTNAEREEYNKIVRGLRSKLLNIYNINENTEKRLTPGIAARMKQKKEYQLSKLSKGGRLRTRGRAHGWRSRSRRVSRRSSR